MDMNWPQKASSIAREFRRQGNPKSRRVLEAEILAMVAAGCPVEPDGRIVPVKLLEFMRIGIAAARVKGLIQ